MNSDERRLRMAFQKSGLWRQGYTYDSAIHQPVLAICLNNLANPRQKQTVPKQMVIKA